MLKRFAFSALIVALFMVFSTMAMATPATDTETVAVTFTVASMISINDLDAFVLAGSMPGTISGTDGFEVASNIGWSGTITCANFEGVTALPVVTQTPATFAGPTGTTDCTVNVSVNIATTDTAGDKLANLVVTVTTST